MQDNGNQVHDIPVSKNMDSIFPMQIKTGGNLYVRPFQVDPCTVASSGF